MMRRKIAAVDDGIAQCLVFIINAHLGTKTSGKPLEIKDFNQKSSYEFGGLGHLLEPFEIFIDTKFTIFGRDALSSFDSHL